MNKAALISVSNRDGLVPLARALSSSGYTLLTTSGSGKFLAAEGIESTSIESYTGQKEILDGRVKTLHPKIHAGLLARRESPEHLEQLRQENILPIDIAIINLYPFIDNLKGDAAADPAKMIELIDVGGPTMIRAAAKNFRSVLPLLDPGDYPEAIQYINSGLDVASMPMDFKLRLATRVFTTISNYDLEISRYLSNLSHESSSWTVDRGDNYQLGGTVGRILVKQQELRYGENPHQKAALYRDIGSKNSAWEQLGGKELSYNNLLDFDAALRLISAFKDASPTVAIIKHSNPCGVASAEELPEALRKSKLCDPRSHFGGIIACNRTVCSKTAAEVAEDFAEIILAPGFEADALQVLQKKKNLRIIKAPLGENLGYEFRSVVDGVLIQEPDTDISRAAQAEVVSARKPDSALLEDLQFAWTICAHVKSNAIVIVRDRMMVGSGTGQMSRIDSVELAIHKARTHGHNLRGSVAASDAFFPFPDSVMTLSDAGVTAIIAPAGSKKDTETIEAANRNAQVLLFARDRHFRH